jgi:L-galactose dehydrogenase/L-glyceraldehyde 3-phosphate reductase
VIDRPLGRTGIRVSAIAFGAGPVSGLMTGSDFDAQLATVARALEAGINWFDTAPGYGQGQSEANLGRVLAQLSAKRVHVATKVRVPEEAVDHIGDYIQRSVAESLERLRMPRITLLQLHNGITVSCGDEPSSLTPRDILGPIGDAFGRLREEGVVSHLGLTGTGTPAALREVVRSGAFDTLQVPFNILNPSAGRSEAVAPDETDYGNIISDCAAMGLGVFAIRVFAGGALLGHPPSAHTLKTPFFPLALYERDANRAVLLRQRVGDRFTPAEFAVRFALSHPGVSSALIGFGSPQHVDELLGLRLDEPL